MTVDKTNNHALEALPLYDLGFQGSVDCLLEVCSLLPDAEGLPYKLSRDPVSPFSDQVGFSSSVFPLGALPDSE
ncbi:hypothetical protein SDC9_78743 [bioreactor metagenome]|uniref:Uncharacterized protein n=1 Tax=bioreactor metagenome TaxID=1076179 RepID=A0A644Z1Y6_9ZZZZ